MTTLPTADLDKHNDVSVIRHIDIEPQSHRPNRRTKTIYSIFPEKIEPKNLKISYYIK